MQRQGRARLSKLVFRPHKTIPPHLPLPPPRSFPTSLYRCSGLIGNARARKRSLIMQTESVSSVHKLFCFLFFLFFPLQPCINSAVCFSCKRTLTQWQDKPPESRESQNNQLKAKTELQKDSAMRWNRGKNYRSPTG